MVMKIRKVALVQHILSHYREPIFRLLCQQQDGVEYTLFSDPVNTRSSVKTIDPQKAAIPVEQGGLRWRFLKNISFYEWLWQSGVVRLSLSKEFDTIIYEGSSYFISTWVGAALARLTGKRVLMWSHGFLKKEKGFKGWLKKIFYRLADGMLLYHNKAKDILIKKGFNSENLHVVYNSLDYDTQIKIRATISDDDKAACRKKLFKKTDLPILLFIGRLTRKKKLLMILKAAKLLKDKGRECNILFVGDGPISDKLRKMARQMNLDTNLCLFGPCYDEKENALLISTADICVAPGEVGLTCMHSLVYGTPVITHDDPDFQMPEYEAITPGYNGAFFKKDSVEDMAVVIERWLMENPVRETTTKRCYEIIDRYYNPHYQIKIIRAAVMDRYFSSIILTNLPAFYKINLYNRIAEKKKILVIFIEVSDPHRSADFYKDQRNFEYLSLGEYRGIKRILKFISLLKKIRYDELIIGGWDYLECWSAAFMSGKDKNAVVIESSILESLTTGRKGWLKYLFMARISTAYASGKFQKDLALELGFKGELKITKGVGIFNIVKQPSYSPVDKVIKFIYVGRLSPEKNLVNLIKTFNNLPYLTLNIIGFGPQENELKQMAGSNIVFQGAVANAELPKHYRENDVLILPSTSEPWGLVVEEALNNGLPVIVSNKVGCSAEIVIQNQNGIIFDLNDKDGLMKAILKITTLDYYNSLRNNICDMDFEKIADEQVNCYL